MQPEIVETVELVPAVPSVNPRILIAAGAVLVTGAVVVGVMKWRKSKQGKELIAEMTDDQNAE